MPAPPAVPRAENRRLLALTALPGAVRAAWSAWIEGAPAAGDEAPLPPEGWDVQPDAARGHLLLERRAGRPPRPWAHADRFAAHHLLLHWQGERLGAAWLRLPGERWLSLHPAAGDDPRWGTCDVLHVHEGLPDAAAGEPVGRFPARDYAAPATLPPLDRPGALPPGAGGAVVNLLALLMAQQGRRTTHYRGPYPTPALFGTLQRAFRPEGPPGEALAAFTREEAALAYRGESADSPVAWRPAPHAPCRPAERLLVHVREGVETAWVDAVAFRRAAGGEAGDAPLPAGERVWLAEAGPPARYGVGLVLLGRPWRRFYLLDALGGVQRADPPPPGDADAESAPGTPLHPLWPPVVFAWSALRANPGLAAALLALQGRLRLEWAPLPLTLAAGTPEAVRLQAGLAGEFARRRAGEDAGTLAMMLVSDVLEGAGPVLRRLAQQALEALPRPEALARLRAGPQAQADARAQLEGALPALVSAVVQGGALPAAQSGRS